MAGTIYVVYVRAAHGLKLWPVAAFFNHAEAAQHAAAFAAQAQREGMAFGATGYQVTKTEVRAYPSWAAVPALSRGL
jgi:hypothetical protein